MKDRKLVLDGLKGFAFDAWSIAVPFVLMCIALVALAFAVASVMFVVGYYVGLASREDFPFPDWAFVPVHVVAIGVALVFAHALELPNALKKRGAAFKAERAKERAIIEAQQRLGERGAYKDPARNRQQSQGGG